MSANVIYADGFAEEDPQVQQNLLSQQQQSFYPQQTQYVAAVPPAQQVILMNSQPTRQVENHSSTALLLCLLGCFFPTIGPIFHCINCCSYANNESMDESTRFWGKFSCAALVFYGVMIAVSIILLVVSAGVLLLVPGLLAAILSNLHINTQ